MVRLGTILAGLLFGFFLSRGRATDHDAIAGTWRFGRFAPRLAPLQKANLDAGRR